MFCAPHRLEDTKGGHKAKCESIQVVANAVRAVQRLRGLGCEDIEFSPEDAGRSEPSFLYRVLAAVIEAGATTVNIPDTVRESACSVREEVSLGFPGNRSWRQETVACMLVKCGLDSDQLHECIAPSLAQCSKRVRTSVHRSWITALLAWACW